MRPHAFLLLCLVIGARAASINTPDEKKLDALDNVELEEIKEPEVEQPVVEVQNDLRNAEIPVSVVEDQQLKKIDENSNDYVPDINDNTAQRRVVELDLKNPGPPQRQEHETQNPGSFRDTERALISIQEKINEIDNDYTEQLKSLSSNFDALRESSDSLPILEQRIQDLKSSFSEKVAEISNAIESYVEPSVKDLKPDLKTNDISSEKLENIQTNLKKIQSDFDSRINVLSDVLQYLRIAKEKGEYMAISGKADATSGTGSPATNNNQASSSPPTNFFNIPIPAFLQTWWSNFQSIGSNNNNAAPTLADVPQTQPQQSGQPFRPLLNFIESINIFRPQTAQQQAVATNVVPAQPSNSVPVAQNTEQQNVDTQNVPPQPQQAQKQPLPAQQQPLPAQQQPLPAQQQPLPAQQQPLPAQPQPGPILSLIQNSTSTVVRGVQNAIQRFIPTTPNPSKPREKSAAPLQDRKGGHGGHYNNNGDNNNSNGLIEETPQVENLGKDAGIQEVEEQKIIEEPSSDVKRLISEK